MTAIATVLQDMFTPEDLAWLQETAKLDGSTVGEVLQRALWDERFREEHRKGLPASDDRARRKESARVHLAMTSLQKDIQKALLEAVARDKIPPAFTDAVSALDDMAMRRWMGKLILIGTGLFIGLIIGCGVASAVGVQMPLAEITVWVLVGLTPAAPFLNRVFDKYFFNKN